MFFNKKIFQIEVLGSSISRKLQAGNKVGLFVSCLAFCVTSLNTTHQGAFEPPAHLAVASLKGLWEKVKEQKSNYQDNLDARVSAFVAETFTHFDSDKTDTLRFDELKACFR
jgi:hypothetical protein